MQYVGHIYIEKNDFSPIWYSNSNECPVLLFSESSNHIVLESVLLIQLYPTLCDPVNYSLPWGFPGKSTEVDCHFLLRSILPTQGSNLGLLPWQVVLYHLRHKGSITRNSCSCQGNKQNTFSDTFWAIWEEIKVVSNFHRMRQNTILLSETWVTLSSFTHKKMLGQN